MASFAAQRSLEHLSAAINLHLSEMPCLQAGDVTDDMYPFPAVYQRILNPMTFCFDWQITEHFGANRLIVW